MAGPRQTGTGPDPAGEQAVGRRSPFGLPQRTPEGLLSSLGLPLALLLLIALPLWLWSSGPPPVRVLWATAVGLETPTCESCRLLTPRTPPLEGDDVVELQQALRQFGAYEGPIDGVFSTETAAAVTVLRMKYGLSPVPRVDAAFRRALESQWIAAQPGGFSVPASATPDPPEGDRLIIINIERAQLTFYVGGFPYKTYPVAVGKPSTPSAVGQWKVVNKGVDIGGPFGSRWMGLSVPWGSYGIHGTDNPGSIGWAVSGGCIRMFNWNVEELYEWVPVGTPVHIISPSWTATVSPALPEGAVGLSVVFLQWQMQRLGWNPGEADGRLGQTVMDAVRDLEVFYGLVPDGIADADVLCLLDLDR